MPHPARELTLTYGTTVLGGTSTAYYLDAPLRFHLTPDQALVEADVIVVGSSEGAFASNCAALEAAFATPRQLLEVRFGSAVHETFDPTDAVNTGFNQIPSIVKVGDVVDTGRSRRYHVAVAVTLPADRYANADASSTFDRRSSTVNLYTTDSGRRRCTVTGVYTATAGVTARARYNGQITPYVTALTGAFGGTWETVFDPQVVTDDQNKVCNFSIVLEELIFAQSGAFLDDPTLRRQRLSLTRSADTPGDSVVFGLKAQRLQRVTADYSVAVDKAVTQDLRTVWEGTVRPYLVSLVSKAAGSSGFVESEIPTFDFVENRLAARVTFVAQPGGNLLNARITTDEAESTGVTLIPVWGLDRLRKHRFTGPGTVTRTVTIVTTEAGLPGSVSVAGSGGVLEVIGGNPPPGSVAGTNADAVNVTEQNAVGTPNAGLANAGGVPEPPASPDGGSLTRIFLGSARSSTPRRIGPAAGPFLDVVDRVIVARYEYFVDAAEAT